jgi:hypothetical protein
MRAEGAIPAVAAGCRRYIVRPRHHADAKPPPSGIENSGEEAGNGFLLGRQLVGAHAFDRLGRQDTFTSVLTLVQHHGGEGEIVVDRGDQSAAAERKRRWAAPLAVRAGFAGSVLMR